MSFTFNFENTSSRSSPVMQATIDQEESKLSTADLVSIRDPTASDPITGNSLAIPLPPPIGASSGKGINENVNESQEDFVKRMAAKYGAVDKTTSDSTQPVKPWRTSGLLKPFLPTARGDAQAAEAQQKKAQSKADKQARRERKEKVEQQKKEQKEKRDREAARRESVSQLQSLEWLAIVRKARPDAGKYYDILLDMADKDRFGLKKHKGTLETYRTILELFLYTGKWSQEKSNVIPGFSLLCMQILSAHEDMEYRIGSLHQLCALMNRKGLLYDYSQVLGFKFNDKFFHELQLSATFEEAVKRATEGRSKRREAVERRGRSMTPIRSSPRTPSESPESKSEVEEPVYGLRTSEGTYDTVVSSPPPVVTNPTGSGTSGSNPPPPVHPSGAGTRGPNPPPPAPPVQLPPPVPPPVVVVPPPNPPSINQPIVPMLPYRLNSKQETYVMSEVNEPVTFGNRMDDRPSYYNCMYYLLSYAPDSHIVGDPKLGGTASLQYDVAFSLPFVDVSQLTGSVVFINVAPPPNQLAQLLQNGVTVFILTLSPRNAMFTCCNGDVRLKLLRNYYRALDGDNLIVTPCYVSPTVLHVGPGLGLQTNSVRRLTSATAHLLKCTLVAQLMPIIKSTLIQSISSNDYYGPVENDIINNRPTAIGTLVDNSDLHTVDTALTLDDNVYSMGADLVFSQREMFIPKALVNVGSLYLSSVKITPAAVTALLSTIRSKAVHYNLQTDVVDVVNACAVLAISKAVASRETLFTPVTTQSWWDWIQLKKPMVQRIENYNDSVDNMFSIKRVPSWVPIMAGSLLFVLWWKLGRPLPGDPLTYFSRATKVVKAVKPVYIPPPPVRPPEIPVKLSWFSKITTIISRVYRHVVDEFKSVFKPAGATWWTWIVALIYSYFYPENRIDTPYTPRVLESACVGDGEYVVREGAKFTESSPKRPNKCKTPGNMPLGFQLAGRVPVVASSCSHNEKKAVSVRTLGVRRGNPSDKGMTEWWEAAARLFHHNHKSFLKDGPRLTHNKPGVVDEWITNFAGRRREEMEEARSQLRNGAQPITTVDIFIKKENINKHVNEFKPRAIFQRTPNYQVAIGPRIKRSTEQLKGYFSLERFEKGHTRVIFAVGMTAEKLGACFSAFCKKAKHWSRPVMVAVDGSNWDGTICRQAKKEEIKIWKEWFRYGDHTESYENEETFGQLMDSQSSTYGFTQHGWKIAAPGIQKSGDNNTTGGNSILNAMAKEYIFKKAGVTRYALMVGGDDDFSVVDADDQTLERLNKEYNCSTESGLDLKVELIFTSPKAEFYSGRFYPTADGVVYGPKIGRLLAKQFFCNNKEFHRPDKWDYWVKAVVLGNKAQWSFIPILRVVCARLLELTETVVVDRPITEKHKTYASRPHECTQDTLDMVSSVYGLTVPEILQCEDEIKRVRSVRSILASHVLETMVVVDSDYEIDYRAPEVNSYAVLGACSYAGVVSCGQLPDDRLLEYSATGSFLSSVKTFFSTLEFGNTIKGFKVLGSLISDLFKGWCSAETPPFWLRPTFMVVWYQLTHAGSPEEIKARIGMAPYMFLYMVIGAPIIEEYLKRKHKFFLALIILAETIVPCMVYGLDWIIFKIVKHCLFYALPFPAAVLLHMLWNLTILCGKEHSLAREMGEKCMELIPKQ